MLLIRAASTATGNTWRDIRRELDRMHLVTSLPPMAESRSTPRPPLPDTIRRTLDLPEPPKFLDFTTETETADPPAQNSEL